MKRHAALTSTYSNMLEKHDNLKAKDIKSLARAPKGAARGVLCGLVILLCFMPNASTSNLEDIAMTPKEYAKYYLSNHYEYKCLAQLYGKESAWNPKAANGSHYGIPQGHSLYLKTATEFEQINWGIKYNLYRYGSMCGAWHHFQRYSWH
jgi:hypothetical protein